MFERVTDPAILKQLNGSSSQYEKVTDPSIIKQLNSKSNDSEYKMPNFPYAFRPPTPQETKQTGKNTREAMKGGAQSLINTPEEIANVFGGHLYNKFDFAPKNKAAEVGGVAGDIGSYFLPGGALKTTKYLPLIGKAARAGEEALKAKPVVNYLTKLVKNTGEGALFQKEKNPESSASDVLKAGGLSGAIPAGINAMTSGNPIISTLGKLGVGGALGYQANGYPGIVEGAVAGVAAPKMLKELGFGKSPVSAEMLTQTENPLAKSRYEAGNRLGTPLRPSEAFNNTGMARNEGMISRSEVGGNAMSEIGQERLVKQKEAINNLLYKIYPKTKESNNALRKLYEKSYAHDVSSNVLSDLADDHVISQAMKKVSEHPAYLQDLKNTRPTSVAYLDQVKRALDDMKTNAMGKNGELTNEARIYDKTRKKLIAELDKVSPEYKDARRMAEAKNTRRDLERALNTKEITANNFFNKFLRNDNKYEEILHKLRNNSEAKNNFKDMKLAWEHLIGTETPRAAAGASAKSMSTARNEMVEMWNKFKDTFGAPRDVQRAEFIHDPKWWDKFDEVMQYKDKVKRNEKLGDLIARSTNAGLIESQKGNK